MTGNADPHRSLRAENTRLRGQLNRARRALSRFTFPAYPDKFQSTDGGMTETLVEDEAVQEARAVIAEGEPE